MDCPNSCVLVKSTCFTSWRAVPAGTCTSVLLFGLFLMHHMASLVVITDSHLSGLYLLGFAFTLLHSCLCACQCVLQYLCVTPPHHVSHMYALYSYKCLDSLVILWSENLKLISQGPTKFFEVNKFTSTGCGLHSAKYSGPDTGLNTVSFWHSIPWMSLFFWAPFS